MPAITVIVPVYNGEKYIKRCLDSLLVQSFRDMEVLMIDDGSTDCSGEICREYAEKHKSFRYIYKENGGASEARNCGVKAAMGDWLSFVDCDDYVERDFLKKMWEQAVGCGAQMVCCGYLYEKNGYAKPYFYPVSGLISPVDFWKSILLGEEIGGFMCNKMMRADIFRGIRFPKGKIFEDKFILPQLTEICSEIAVLSDTLYHYVFRGSSLSNGFTKEKAYNLIEARNRVYSYVRERFPELEAVCEISRMREAVVLFNSMAKSSSLGMDEILKGEREYILCHWKYRRYLEQKLRLGALMIRLIPGVYKRLQYLRGIKEREKNE